MEEEYTMCFLWSYGYVSILGSVSFIAYSSNVLLECGGSVFTIADPSPMKTSDSGFFSGSVLSLVVYQPGVIWYTCGVSLHH